MMTDVILLIVTRDRLFQSVAASKLRIEGGAIHYLRSLSAAREWLATSGTFFESCRVVVDADSLAGVNAAALESLQHPNTTFPTQFAIVASGMIDPRLYDLCQQRPEFVWISWDAETWHALRQLVESNSSKAKTLSEQAKNTGATCGTRAVVPSKPMTQLQAAYRMYGKVLSVDDDPDVTRFLQMRLQLLGLDVMRAGDGIEGFRAALEWRPDVIITDFSMPEGLGSYLMGRLRDCGVDIPTIFLSGVVQDSNTGIVEQFRDLGAHAVLSKPVDWTKLITAIRQVIHIPDTDDGLVGRPSRTAHNTLSERSPGGTLDRDTLVEMYYPEIGRPRVHPAELG